MAPVSQGRCHGNEMADRDREEAWRLEICTRQQAPGEIIWGK